MSLVTRHSNHYFYSSFLKHMKVRCYSANLKTKRGLSYEFDRTYPHLFTSTSQLACRMYYNVIENEFQIYSERDVKGH